MQDAPPRGPELGPVRHYAYSLSGEHIFGTKNGKFIAFPVSSDKWSLSSVLMKKVQLGVLEPSDGHQSPEYTKQSIW